MERLFERLLLSQHLRAIVWTLCVVFCITVWVIGISLGVKAWELASTFFKGV